MGGRISVQSTLNKGSTFTILLNNVDIAAVSNAPLQRPSHEDFLYHFHSANLLIVDDVADNRALIKENLSLFSDLKLTEACNGQEAINELKKNSYDLILMDIRMPIMDGYEATHIIKGFTNTPIVALTASVVIGEFQPLKKDDFDGYLRKPVLKNDLFKELRNHLKYDKIEKVGSRNEALSVTPEESYHLLNAIQGLKSLESERQKVTLSNDIPSIENFAEKLTLLNSEHPIKAVETYTFNLLENLESFDISGIKMSLNQFPDFISKLEDIANQKT